MVSYIYPLFLLTTSFFFLLHLQNHILLALDLALSDAILCFHEYVSDFSRPLRLDCNPQTCPPLCGCHIASIQVIYESL